MPRVCVYDQLPLVLYACGACGHLLLPKGKQIKLENCALLINLFFLIGPYQLDT